MILPQQRTGQTPGLKALKGSVVEGVVVDVEGSVEGVVVDVGGSEGAVVGGLAEGGVVMGGLEVVEALVSDLLRL